MNPTKNTVEYQKIPVSEALKILETDENGLSESEAEGKIKKFGFNEIISKEKSPIADFLGRFWGPIPWLLEIAAVLACIVGQIFDGLLIFLLLLMNVVIGFVEEQKSHKALELLKKKMKIKARVLRDGKWVTKEARDLVPGDIIIVGLGDLVPADGKIITGGVSADQSALTGESLPVNLKESEIIFNGATIKRGEARCVVVGTGKNTYFGKTVELVNVAKPKSRQEAVMMLISKYMIYLGAIVFLIVLWHGLSVHAGALTILTFAVLFIGGGVPAALPVMFTVSQASGAGELAEKGILVTKLDAIENAASVEVLCLDKTGTITKNELEINEVTSLNEYKENEVLLFAGLASSEGSKDMIDSTVLNYVNSKNIELKQYKLISFAPFEPATKRAEAVVEINGKKIKAVKGATQILLSLCKNTDKKTIEIATKKVEELSFKGCRAIAVARSKENKLEELEMVGILALADPIRPDTKDMINDMKNAGIRPMMITGDNIAVAKEIAKQAQIGDAIARISELKAMGEEKMATELERYNGIAEIYPEDKFSIVTLWQSRGKMVGMTGDGVNDAPALKQAEMGVAVSNSTDVAKAAASIVLTEPGTRLIIEAVKTSRQIFQRMMTWAINKITKSIQFLGIATVGFLWFEDIVISITGLMLIVFINDFLTLTLAKDNARSTSNPNNWNVKNLSLASGFLGILFMLQGIYLLWMGIEQFKLTFEEIQTMILLFFAYTTMFRIWIVRERGHCWDSWPSKTVILTTIITVILFSWLAISGILLKELPVHIMLFTLIFCGIVTFLIDIPKYYVFKKLGL